MKKRAIALTAVVVVAAVIAIVAISLTLKPHSSGQAINSQSPSSAQGNALFSQSQYYQFSYLIFPGALSPNAKKAITGFNLDLKNNSDGSTTVNLVAVNPEYKTQEYTVKPGEKLYFIERTLRDDSSGEDMFPSDDMAVVVDSNGYIIQGPGSA